VGLSWHCLACLRLAVSVWSCLGLSWFLLACLGDTSLQSRAESELKRHEGAAGGSCQLRHSDASQRGISDVFLSEWPSLVAVL
jgi:hypothetical protein